MQGGDEDEPQSPPAEEHEERSEARSEARESGRGICGWSMSVLYDK
jgi:hypothetical protein